MARRSASRDPEPETWHRKSLGPTRAAASGSSPGWRRRRAPGTAARNLAPSPAPSSREPPVAPLPAAVPGATKRDLLSGRAVSPEPLPAAPGSQELQRSLQKWTFGRAAGNKNCHGAQTSSRRLFCSACLVREMTQRIGLLFCCLTRGLPCPPLFLLGVTCHAVVGCSLLPGLEGSARLWRLSSNVSHYELGSCETEAKLALSLDFWTLSSENLIGTSWHSLAVLLISGWESHSWVYLAV